VNISTLSNAPRTTPESGLDAQQRLVTEPAQADIDLFSAAMDPDSGHRAALTESMVSLLAERLGDSQKLSQKALRQMKKAAVADDGSDIVEMSRALSQCSLQMALTTKIVNKGAQALEKLTNLQ
jgi:type III secretion system YscI/HrpB-like protein